MTKYHYYSRIYTFIFGNYFHPIITDDKSGPKIWQNTINLMTMINVLGNINRYTVKKANVISIYFNFFISR